MGVLVLRAEQAYAAARPNGRNRQHTFEADAALGLLQGLTRLLPDPQLLVGPYMTREAVASSRIEGTQTSLSEVLQAEASGTNAGDEDVAEVERYLQASRLGFRLIKDLPITQRLILQLHKELMEGVRGEEKLPGEIRRSPVWVGSPTDNPDTALYVPPLPSELPDLISDWEFFVNEPPSLPVLVRCALMHYQFETIHPFLDGNGRIGRLIVNLMLVQERRLTTPVLYLSGYLEANRREYYERLQGVRERGEVQQWIQFFLTAVKRQADDAVNRSGALVEVREKYRSQTTRVRSKLPAIIDLLFQNPFLNVRRVENALGVTAQGARNLIRDAEGRGWVREVGTFGRGGGTYWVADEIFRVIEAPMNYPDKSELGSGADQRNEEPLS